jgi:hypothetical protein
LWPDDCLYMLSTQLQVLMWVTINGKVEQKELEAALEERTGCPYIVVGPARFTNHDCDSNARLVTCDSFSIGVEAKRKIHPGEEITASYGEHYFGDTGEGSGNKLETERGSIRSGVTVLQLQKEEREHWVAACSSSTKPQKAKGEGARERIDSARNFRPKTGP